MDNRDYIIAFDENGQPYIAHTLWQRVKSMTSGRVSKGASRGAQGVGRGVRSAHKYIEKWGEGAKARYFYTQEELKAALNQGRQKVSQAASSARQAVGNAAARGRAALTTASEKARSAASSVSTKARDLSTRTSSILQKHGSETLSAIKSGASAVRDRAKELSGKDAHQRYEEAWERTSAAKDRLASNPNSAYAQREVDRAEEAEAKAHEDYLKTPLGRLNDTKSRVQEAAQYAADRAKELADKAGEKVSSTAASASERAKDTAARATEKAREIASSAAERAKAAGTKVSETAKGAVERAKDVAGFDEKERADAAWEEYDKVWEAYQADKSRANKRAVDVAFDKATKLNDEYLSTPLGKIDSTAAKFQEEVQGTVGRALEKAESIKEQVKAIDPSIKIMGDTMTLPGGTEIKIPEVFIKEQTIPESYINEILIEEQKIEEQKSRK